MLSQLLLPQLEIHQVATVEAEEEEQRSELVLREEEVADPWRERQLQPDAPLVEELVLEEDHLPGQEA